MKLTQLVRARRTAVFAAFLDRDAVLRWLPPAGMRAELHSFDARPGGGFSMTLTYEGEGQGKTTADSDVSHVRFVEIRPDERIVQAVTFAGERADVQGTMTLAWSFADAPGGTEVSVEVRDAPLAISDADHEIGIRSSLTNLDCWLSGL